MLRRISIVFGFMLMCAASSPGFADDSFKAKGDFCRQQMAGIDRRASTEALETFSQLNRCEKFCSTASAEQNSAPLDQLAIREQRCDTAFAGLPAEVLSRFGAAPDADDLSAASEASARAEECRALATQYPRLANDRRGPSFNKCSNACDDAAMRIEDAGYDVAGYAAACEREYTGAMSRLPR